MCDVYSTAEEDIAEHEVQNEGKTVTQKEEQGMQTLPVFQRASVETAMWPAGGFT